MITSSKTFRAQLRGLKVALSDIMGEQREQRDAAVASGRRNSNRRGANFPVLGRLAAVRPKLEELRLAVEGRIQTLRSVSLVGAIG